VRPGVRWPGQRSRGCRPAGDASEQPAATTAPVYVVQPAPFVLWGGNTPGLALGQHVNFWGSQWASQVTGGDYQANPSFKGFANPATPAAAPLALCEASARTSGTPQLDASCWTSKPGNSPPPATLGDYLEAIVSTSIAKQGSKIYGNIAALVVVRVDPGSGYAPDPGHPGFGTIVAVIADGAGLFLQAASRRPAGPPEKSGPASPANEEAHGVVLASAPLPGERLGLAAAAGNRRYYLYTPELHLAAETELTSGANPAVLYEYVWFGSMPVAQTDATGLVSWTFTDHLGTPLLQTSGSQGVSWRAEAEPYGAVFALRSADVHQPLRLPGQEAEQLNLGANGATERSYNIHRWYRSTWSLYTQADPAGIDNGTNLLAYALNNPNRFTDPSGLSVSLRCRDVGAPEGPLDWKSATARHVFGAKHCFLEVRCRWSIPPTLISYGLAGRPKVQVVPNYLGSAATPNNDVQYSRAGKFDEFPVLPAGDSHCCSFERCVLSLANSLASSNFVIPQDTYSAIGPNSNSFAHRLILQCGGKLGVPLSEVGQDGAYGIESPWNVPLP